MNTTLDDETAQESAQLMRAFKDAVAQVIKTHYREHPINWSSVTTALMMVSADTNNVVKLDHDEANHFFRQFMQGRHYGEQNDLNRECLANAAKNGNADAQFRLGLLYERGDKSLQNAEEALRLFHMAASVGLVAAQSKLGLLYAQGSLVDQDHESAVEWFRKAAENGDAIGQYNLGFAYSRGFGVARDHRDAISWWTLAAEQGNAQAQHDLGWNYVDGSVVQRDYVTAMHWYKLAAAQGFKESQNNLGEMYLNGQGVPKDLVLAYSWFYLAARDGDSDALQSLSNLEEILTVSQVNMGKELARDWQGKRPNEGLQKSKF